MPGRQCGESAAVVLNADLQKPIRTRKRAGAEIKLHREDAVRDIHSGLGDRVRRPLQIAVGQRVVQLELEIVRAVGRRAAISQATLISES